MASGCDLVHMWWWPQGGVGSGLSISMCSSSLHWTEEVTPRHPWFVVAVLIVDDVERAILMDLRNRASLPLVREVAFDLHADNGVRPKSVLSQGGLVNEVE